MTERKRMKEVIVPADDLVCLGKEKLQELIRCKECKYYREDGDCWHEWDNDGRIYYQSVINEPNPDDYCSRAERKEESREVLKDEEIR